MSQRTIKSGRRSVRRFRPTSPDTSDLAQIFSKFLLVVFVAGGGYLYAVNQNAVQGYQIRTLEKEIARLKDENAELKITEADLRSLYRIEASGSELEMQKLENVKYLEAAGPVAYTP